MKNEAWKPIQSHPDYEASSFGRIRSIDRIDALGRHKHGKVLKAFQRPSGYWHVSINCVTKNVHSLVADAFHGTRPVGMQCCHINGDRSDNRSENLRWGSASSNRMDSIRHGTFKCNLKVKRVPLESIRLVYALRKAGKSNKEISAITNIKRSYVRELTSGRRAVLGVSDPA